MLFGYCLFLNTADKLTYFCVTACFVFILLPGRFLGIGLMKLSFTATVQQYSCKYLRKRNSALIGRCATELYGLNQDKLGIGWIKTVDYPYFSCAHDFIMNCMKGNERVTGIFFLIAL